MRSLSTHVESADARRREELRTVQSELPCLASIHYL